MNIKQLQKKQQTREEINQAMQAFLSKGKKIKVLPPQEVYTSNVVGADRFSDYEDLDDFQI